MYFSRCPRRSKLAVLEQLIDAAAFVNYINYNLLPLPDSTASSTIVMVREPTYLDAIYTRSLSLNGADVIEIYPYDAVYREVNPSVYTPFRERVVNSSAKNLSPLEKMQVETYLTDRVYDPGRRLSYMKKGLNQANTLKNEKGELIHVLPDSSGAVLFLHSFDDAQYVFGPDGFDDLFDWSVFTLNSLLNNPDIDTVLIKPHPGVDYKNYPGDKRALKRLKKLFPETQKLKWLSHDCGPMALKDLKGFVGITHHGSIAEELVFLRVPVISSTYTPWSTNYQFTVNWSSPSEYGNLLAQNLNQFTVSQENIESLMAYVMEARLRNPITIRDCWPWYNYMEMLGFKSSGSFFEVLEHARNILSIEMFDLERLKIFFEYQYKKYLAR